MPPTLKRLATEEGSVSPPPLKRIAPSASTTTSSAVANFFKPASQKDPEKVAWKVIDNTLLYCKYDKADSFAADRPRKIAAFDFDSTLVDAKSGNRFARDGDDWKWWHGQIPSKLKQLAEDGYLLAILSNQAGISMNSASKTVNSDKKRLADFKQRVKGVLTQLDLPIVLYAATEKDKFRKPRTGMWDRLLEAQGLTQEDVDLEACYFVGDAGGRTAVTRVIKADFSCSDRDLASNVGIKFMTPEEFFLGEDPRPFTRTFDPSAHVSPVLTSKTDASPVAFTRKSDLELVIFCGSPGAGKSTWFQQHLKPLGYERVNQDLLKSRDRCLKVAKEFLEDGKSVAVDNTNADFKAREYWTNLADSLEVPIRCVHFTAPSKLCEHNDAVRSIGGSQLGVRTPHELRDAVKTMQRLLTLWMDDQMNPESRTMLPRQAFTGFAARYNPPTLDEGFVDITNVDFEFSGTEEQKTAWSKFWL